MHTYVAGNTWFNYNSDFSGDVEIVTHTDEGTQEAVTLRVEHLLRFVADCYILPERIAAMEKASYLDLLLK